ncbi:MAG: FkbM family methyltransferase [Proteobacteria bacterium]|nr:FkbM family methyltransferase [Pseudomonadota bacterium]
MLKTKQKIAIANLAQTAVMGVRCLLGKGPNTKVRRSNVEWDLDLREGIDFSIWLLGSFEPETVRCYKKIVKAGDVVLDIGANIGAHTLPLAQAVGAQGKVIAFEPTDYAYAKLSKNCLLNPDLAERIHCLQVMLVDSEIAGKPTPGLYSSWPLKEEIGLHELHQGRLMTTTGADARMLDSVILSLKLDRVDFIKLDIDGFECGMMRGASGVLSKWKPTIIMELSPYVLDEQGSSLDELIDLLRKHTYALYDLSAKKEISMDSAQLHKMIPKGAGMNVLAIANR